MVVTNAEILAVVKEGRNTGNKSHTKLAILMDRQENQTDRMWRLIFLLVFAVLGFAGIKVTEFLFLAGS